MTRSSDDVVVLHEEWAAITGSLIGADVYPATVSLWTAMKAYKAADDARWAAEAQIRSALFHFAALVGDDEAALRGMVAFLERQGDVVKPEWVDAALGGAEAARQANVRRLRALPYQEYLQTPEWRGRRERKLAGVGHRCQVCGVGEAQGAALEVHHRSYEAVGNEDPADLTVLCGACHEIFHRRMKKAPEVKEWWNE